MTRTMAKAMKVEVTSDRDLSEALPAPGDRVACIALYILHPLILGRHLFSVLTTRLDGIVLALAVKYHVTRGLEQQLLCTQPGRPACMRMSACFGGGIAKVPLAHQEKQKALGLGVVGKRIGRIACLGLEVGWVGVTRLGL